MDATNAMERWAALPEGQLAEVLNGQLHMLPSPTMAHNEVASGLYLELTQRYRRGIEGPGGWVFVEVPNLRIGAELLIPDLAGWRRESFESVQRTQAVTDVVPQWIGEVLSPSTKARDRNEKLPAYFKAGVETVWLIAPLDRIVEVYVNGALVAAADLDERVQLPPFTATPLDMSWVWEGL